VDTEVDWSRTHHVALLAHEATHVVDSLRHPVWYHVSYVACLPIWRTMRARWEYRAFGVQMGVWVSRDGSVPEWLVEQVADSLGTSQYAWADPPRARALGRAGALRDAAEGGQIDGLDPDGVDFSQILQGAP